VSLFLSSASSERRPIKLVASVGRLPERRIGLAMVNSTLLGPASQRRGRIGT
jgi:hypothetical protein